jgi:hypothetical protein
MLAAMAGIATITAALVCFLPARDGADAAPA